MALFEDIFTEVAKHYPELKWLLTKKYHLQLMEDRYQLTKSLVIRSGRSFKLPRGFVACGDRTYIAHKNNICPCRSRRAVSFLTERFWTRYFLELGYTSVRFSGGLITPDMRNSTTCAYIYIEEPGYSRSDLMGCGVPYIDRETGARCTAQIMKLINNPPKY